ncbi:hypothetical protein DFP72DRAFT_973436 [Ephemerocybe angulata]|uniref:Uncharacterized protein n=1 Tax=Ephemerocybe angulata TaxID=980116 RepID=A0A8H6LXH6_9AGAR|nr:hypothetical protein DFP72DRAFT_973436 [Tulosesus angulatus]
MPVALSLLYIYFVERQDMGISIHSDVSRHESPPSPPAWFSVVSEYHVVLLLRLMRLEGPLIISLGADGQNWPLSTLEIYTHTHTHTISFLIPSISVRFSINLFLDMIVLRLRCTSLLLRDVFRVPCSMLLRPIFGRTDGQPRSWDVLRHQPPSVIINPFLPSSLSPLSFLSFSVRPSCLSCKVPARRSLTYTPALTQAKGIIMY